MALGLFWVRFPRALTTALVLVFPRTTDLKEWNLSHPSKGSSLYFLRIPAAVTFFFT